MPDVPRVGTLAVKPPMRKNIDGRFRTRGRSDVVTAREAFTFGARCLFLCMKVRNMDGDSEPTVKAILSLLEKLLISVLALVREGGRGTYHIIHGPVGVHITVVDILGC